VGAEVHAPTGRPKEFTSTLCVQPREVVLMKRGAPCVNTADSRKASVQVSAGTCECRPTTTIFSFFPPDLLSFPCTP